MRSSSRFSLLAVVALALLGTRPAATQGKPQQTVLHKFQNNETDGQTPYAGVLIDRAGNLYGTTIFGGRGGCTNGYDPGCGTVFELSPKKDGGWTETVLYSFQDNGADGIEPEAGLIFDKAGNLYGTTSEGGSGKCGNGLSGCGAVFELSPQSGGGWSEAVLYSFQNNGTDGHLPQAGLIFDNTGNLYGTTEYGGLGGCTDRGFSCGTVFALSRKSDGRWADRIFSFNGTNGYLPMYGVISDTDGNLYGTTFTGGSGGCKDGAEPFSKSRRNFAPRDCRLPALHGSFTEAAVDFPPCFLPSWQRMELGTAM